MPWPGLQFGLYPKLIIRMVLSPFWVEAISAMEAVQNRAITLVYSSVQEQETGLLQGLTVHTQ